MKQDKEIYKHIPTGMFLLMDTERDSEINTYIDCDELGNIIYAKRSWSVHKQQQHRIVKGFDNLIKLK